MQSRHMLGNKQGLNSNSCRSGLIKTLLTIGFTIDLRGLHRIIYTTVFFFSSTQNVKNQDIWTPFGHRKGDSYFWTPKRPHRMRCPMQSTGHGAESADFFDSIFFFIHTRWNGKKLHLLHPLLRMVFLRPLV